MCAVAVGIDEFRLVDDAVDFLVLRREGSLIDRRRDAKAVPPGRPFAFVRAEMVGAARIELATPPV